MSKILSSIPADALEDYKAYRISSAKLGEMTGFHPAAIRRAIKREPRVPKDHTKKSLMQMRKAFHKTLAHLPPREIQRIAHVSASTANRIRKLNHAT